ncbi:uncharacterized protein LOC126366978 [Pectinophora gossypiella]|uniref:uncharacterized protein LOC126366978 n=1 Tax=Pectinophora gossypiella TaxID=13191 RepID=UPI00214F4AF8|nr:uncharacterized protein LOC126366978 [Pectinophora gossypiella]
MPKRKHCDDGDKIERYKRKIRKLEEKSRQKETRKRVITYSSSDSEKNSDDEQPIKDVEAAESAEDLLPDDPAPAEDSANADSVEIPQLDPEILAALGESTQDTPNFGPKIHDSLAQLWLPILRKGLDKEVKEKLLKQFLIPENCPLLKAPKLNPEISAVVPEASKARDKRVETVQQQLGLGITALNKGLELLLDDGQNRLEAIKYLSDSCRLLCEVHFTETEARKKFVTPGLNKTFLNIVQDVERDEMLFTVNKPFSSVGKLVEPPLLLEQRGEGGSKTDISSRSWQGHANGDPFEADQPEQAASHNATAIENASSSTPQSYPGGRDALRLALTRRKTPEVALDLMLASVSENTMKQYSVTYKLWWQFCHKNSINLFEPDIASVITFLVDQYNKGSSYGSINSHRSALSLLVGNNVGSDEQVKRLLKGVYKLKTPRPKYNSTWDPQVVLNHISQWYPNLEICLELLTKKLVVLLALCTGHRLQTLSLIKINNICTSSSGLKILITDIVKTSAAGRDQPLLVLPYFVTNPAICPAKTLEDYLSATANLRPEGTDNLLVSYKRPHKKATSQTIGRWIKQTLAVSGIDVAVFGAHSTRHASTSAAATAGVCVDTIRKAAGWTSTSLTFARFYNRPVSDDGVFARAVAGETSS